MVCKEQPLVEQIFMLYEKISNLESLKPCEDVNTLFTQLVTACIDAPQDSIDVSKLCDKVQQMKPKLIRLCGEAEGHLESHYSTILATFDNPLDHLTIFPYFNNYIKLSQLESNLLNEVIHNDVVPKRIAFVGSGPLPLTSICLAKYHLTTTSFHNYDIDPSANSLASELIKADDDVSQRMFFHTRDIMDVDDDELKSYDVVFLAALVGMDKKDKVKAIVHLGNNMAPGAILMLRSAHGARAFLYPVIDPDCDLADYFEVLSVYHPTDEVVNSVVIARKKVISNSCAIHHKDLNHLHHPHHIGAAAAAAAAPPMILPALCKCQVFNALNHGKRFDQEFPINEEQC